MNEDSELKQIGERHRRRNRWVVSIFVIIAVIGGGTAIMIEKNNEKQKKEHEYMVKVVKSDEAKKIIEKGLKRLDPNALSEDGVIQSYTIGYNSIKHNPMGGINFTIFVNNDTDLYVYYTINKNSDGVLKDEGGGNSMKLEGIMKKDR